MIKNVFRLCMLTCVSACIFMGCEDKDYYDPEKDPNYVGDKPSTLDFSTSQTVKLLFNYDIANGFVSTFSLYTDYPMTSDGSLRTDMEPIAAGIYVAGYSDITRTIPSYVTDLYLYSSTLFVPMLSHAKIENGVASFEDIGVDIAEEVTTRAGNAGDLWSRKISKYLRSADDYYMDKTADHFMYDLIPGSANIINEIPLEVMTAIGNTFPEKKRLQEREGGKFIQDANFHVRRADTRVYVSILYAGCTINNSLSYYVYTGDKDFQDLTKEETAKLELINLYQLAEANNNKVRSVENRKGLTPGKYIQLLYKNSDGDYVEEFPENAKIGWKLHRNGFLLEESKIEGSEIKVKEMKVKENAESLFSTSVWNDPKRGDNGHSADTRYTIYFQTKDNNNNIYNCFGFEDVIYNSDEDYNDLIFHVLTDPADGLVPPPSIVEEDIEKTEKKKGVLAFEDNWPEQGDYDLNDVVIKYSSDITYVYTVKKEGQTTTSTDVTVKKVTDNFSFIHNGATFSNAFSYKIDLSPNVIEGITITDEKTGNVTDYTTKISADGNGFIIDLCPKNPLPSMVMGATPYNYTVVMEFKDGAVLQDDFAKVAAPYNPFITPTGNFPGAEVHLSMYRPTNRVDMDLFGTEDDRSNKSNLWYVSGTNNKYPFAIHLDGADAHNNFVIPKEEEKINITYPRYMDWVESDMNSDKDWYKK